jgi:hypothetical protein
VSERREKPERRKAWRFEPPPTSTRQASERAPSQYARLLHEIGLLRLGLSLLAVGLSWFAANVAWLVLSGGAALGPPFGPLLERVSDGTWLFSGFFTILGAMLIYIWLDRS